VTEIRRIIQLWIGKEKAFLLESVITLKMSDKGNYIKLADPANVVLPYKLFLGNFLV
jgi:hypothetical protein